MSIIEQTRIALLELFPELAAADAEARAKAEAEAEAVAVTSELDAATEELAAVHLVPGEAEEQATETAAAPKEEAPKAGKDSAAEDKEAEDEGPRQNGVLTTNYTQRGTHLDVLCEPDQVVEAARILDQAGFFIEAVTGVDWIKEDQIEVIYDYSHSDKQLCRVVVRARIPRSNPEIPTISNVFPGADWHERETFDFFGINFQGHPNLIRILLPEDTDFYPLLKDFTP